MEHNLLDELKIEKDDFKIKMCITWLWEAANTKNNNELISLDMAFANEYVNNAQMIFFHLFLFFHLMAWGKSVWSLCGWVRCSLQVNILCLLLSCHVLCACDTLFVSLGY